MTTLQAQFLAPILSGSVIPEETLVYFRTRLRLRLQEFLLREFAHQQDRAKKQGSKFTRADLARRIHRKPELVTRWLGVACNLTADTISDLLLGMGAEPDFAAGYLADVITEEPTDAAACADTAILRAAPPSKAQIMDLRPALRARRLMEQNIETIDISFPSSGVQRLPMKATPKTSEDDSDPASQTG